MDPNTGIDPNLETPQDMTPDNGGNGEGTPDGQGGTPDPRDQQIADLRKQNQLLNKNVIDARRQPGRNPKSNDPSEIDLSTPEGQYGVALQVAENQVRSKLEEVLPLYPELTPDMVQRIRRNPWSFASREAMLTGNAELAALEIEQAIYDHIESLSKDNPPAPSSGNPAKVPASVNNNSVPESQDGEIVIPGTFQDQNPWTMPLDKLEQMAIKESRTAKK